MLKHQYVYKENSKEVICYGLVMHYMMLGKHCIYMRASAISFILSFHSKTYS